MGRIANNIELVSLHIPKTAGTSFRSIFIDNVGERNFAKVDIFNSGRIKVNDAYFSDHKLNRKVTAIHGHFPYSVLLDRFEIHSTTQFITWVRNPIERVLSNYYFLRNVIQERINEQQDENLFERIGKSLEEFVLHPENQNVMSKFLKGAPLEEFTFIGVQDQFDSELLRMQQLLGWQVTNRAHNITQNKKERVEHGAEMLDFIQTHNQEDMELYQRVIALNSKSMNA
jgi:hypothetical protein